MQDKSLILQNQIIIAVMLITFSAFCGIFFVSEEQRYIVAPILVMVIVVTGTVWILWRRDHCFPFFDAGVICLLAISVYALFPLAQFLLSNNSWSVFSDNRMLNYNVSSGELGRFAWWPTTYILSIAGTYMLARGNKSIRINNNVEPPDILTLRIIIAMVLMIFFYFLFIKIIFGLDYDPSYKEMMATESFKQFETLPVAFKQITHNLLNMFLMLKISLIVILLIRWDKRYSRYILFSWILVEIVLTFSKMGARTSLALLILATILAYDKLVKSIKVSTLLIISTFFLFGLLAYGFLRDLGDEESLIISASDVVSYNFNNEFQSLYGTAYDLKQKKEDGLLDEIPWTVRAGDVLMFIPQQILPFEKWDPAEWYLDLIGIRGTGTGLTFGVLSYAALGYGLFEVAIRGMIWGFILARIHRWYVSRTNEFWATVLYIWVCIWSYYSYRGGTFYVLYYVVFQFFPLYIFIQFLRKNMKKIRLPLKAV